MTGTPEHTPHVDWGLSTCTAFSFFNKVQCQRHEGHEGSHIHDYGNGHICGWENNDDRDT